MLGSNLMEQLEPVNTAWIQTAHKGINLLAGGFHRGARRLPLNLPLQAEVTQDFIELLRSPRILTDNHNAHFGPSLLQA
ncbi:hypothetical protein [Aerolutibacter ruishenii]|uniref:hypothetical protein n=1 Tax=Aerolutibacter ruishenii TaxID=686800 RepID=UPI001F54B678|nr:hypothetical protein [Lysobacter ruishenii]